MLNNNVDINKLYGNISSGLLITDANQFNPFAIRVINSQTNTLTIEKSKPVQNKMQSGPNKIQSCENKMQRVKPPKKKPPTKQKSNKRSNIIAQHRNTTPNRSMYKSIIVDIPTIDIKHRWSLPDLYKKK
jgi:hypothetical protein